MLDKPTDGPAARTIWGEINSRNIKRWVERANVFFESFGPEQRLATIASLYNFVDRVHAEESCSSSTWYQMHQLKMALAKVELTVSDVVQKALASMDETSLLEVLPPGWLAERERTAQQAYAEALQEHVSVADILEANYDTLARVEMEVNARRTLSYAWDESTATHEVVAFNDVPFPKLAGLRSLDTKVKKIKELYGWELDNDGKTATIDLLKKVQLDVQESVRRGFYNVVDGKLADKNGETPRWMCALDAANIHKGMKQTAFAFHLPTGSQHPNSPDEASII